MTVTVRQPQRRRPLFHSLTVATVDQLTDDAVAITLAVPEELRETFAFLPGQHLTVRLPAGRIVADGPPLAEEVRRSYSMCSTPGELRRHGYLRIGVREVADGVFSRYAVNGLTGGDTLDVLAPLGRFTTTLDAGRTRHYGAIAAGSGITPVLSLVATALATEPHSTFTVLYGNRRAGSVMFAEQLADLKDRYPDRLHLVHVLSREPQMSELLSGRLDGQRLRRILESGLVDPSTVDEWFLCGPYGMVMDAQVVLAETARADRVIRTELFHVEAEPTAMQARPESVRVGQGGASTTVTIRLDGRESTFAMTRDERVLDAALKVRGELPYACKGGVCSTCRAKVIEGEVAMARNYALEPDEIAGGYVLTCQSVPLTADLLLDYDA